MLGVGNLHPYQVRAIRHILDQPAAGLWLDMGLGKTAIVLHALMDMFDRLEIYGALVVAPLRVCQTVWRQQAAMWHYPRPLTFSLIHGTREQREKALREPAMVKLINYEGLQWLCDELQHHWLSRGKPLPFNVLVMDEISRLKNTRIKQGGKRGNALLKITPYFKRRIGMTGKPAPQGLLDLFGQWLCLDNGRRLGQSFEAYRNEYFHQMDWNGRVFAPFVHSEAAITALLADATISMRNKDYLNLPPLIVNDIWVHLNKKSREKYDRMEKEFFLELDSGAHIELDSEASKINRCLQVGGGAVYLQPRNPEWEQIHSIKMDALEEIMEEAAGEPVLAAYQFRHEAERILKRWPKGKWIHHGISEKEMISIQNDWDEGRIPLLIGHPKSIGHGLNLQAGGNILVWFGLNWSNDLYSQTVARLRRQGQTRPVTLHRLLCADTMDDVQRIRLMEEEMTENSLRAALEKYRQKRYPE